MMETFWAAQRTTLPDDVRRGLPQGSPTNGLFKAGCNSDRIACRRNRRPQGPLMEAPVTQTGALNAGPSLYPRGWGRFLFRWRAC